MKRLIALTALSLGLGIVTTSCAHTRLRSERTKDVVLGTAVVSALVLAAMLAPCGHCNIGNVDTPALPPR